MQNPWRILGLEPGTDLETVKRKYRELARKYHPDFNKSPDAEQKMKEINEAYNAIMSGRYRRPEWRSFDEDDIFETLNDIFVDIFHIHPRYSHFRQPKNPDITTMIDVTLEEGLSGCRKTIYLPNSGEARVVDIPVGVQDGMILTFSGLGHRHIPNIKPGDLLIKINLVLPPGYELHNHIHLKTHARLNVFDLMTGTELLVDLPTLEKVVLKVPPGTQPGSKLRVKGKGYRKLGDPYTRGDLLVEIHSEVPVVTDPRLKKELEEIRKKIGR